jgi:predicted Ser/Thr protein kinase
LPCISSKSRAWPCKPHSSLPALNDFLERLWSRFLLFLLFLQFKHSADVASLNSFGTGLYTGHSNICSSRPSLPLGSGSLVSAVWVCKLRTLPLLLFRLAGAPVIVKTLDMAHSTRRLPALLNEVYTLKDLPSLWGKRVPRLLAYGPYTQSLYAVVVGEIPGRVLRSTDADHAEDAAEALRSVHQRGYLHGDIKLENFLIGNNGAVFVIDFGLATKSANREAHAREQGALRKCFIY